MKAINMKIDYKTNNELRSEEVINIFQSVGWNKNPNDIIDAFQNSYYVTAYQKQGIAKKMNKENS